jgi:hypothetical protein
MEKGTRTTHPSSLAKMSEQPVDSDCPDVPNEQHISEEDRASSSTFFHPISVVLISRFFPTPEITNTVRQAQMQFEESVASPRGIDPTACEPSELYPGAFRAVPTPEEKLRLMKLDEYDLHGSNAQLQCMFSSL